MLSVALIAALAWSLLRGEAESGDETEQATSKSAKQPSTFRKSVLDQMRETLEREPSSNALAGLAGRGLVAGSVIDADSGDRLGGVDVLFGRGGGEETVTSAADGEFEIELGAGRYRVRAIGDGVIGGGLPDIRVLSGDAPLELLIKVRKLATVSGRVVDALGDGADASTVHFGASRPSDVALTRSGLLLDQVPAESNGDFEIDVLAGGDVVLEARRGFLRARASIGKIGPGELRTGVVLKLDRGVLISGIVLDPQGQPVAGAIVRLGRDRSSGQEVESDRGGRFTFEPMEPTKLVLEARAAGFAPSAPARSLYAPGQIEELTVRLQELMSLSGRVVNADGQGVEGARVRAGRGGSKMVPTDASSASDGSFEFDGLGSGKHWVSASKPGFATATKEGLEPPASDLEFTLVAFGAIAGKVTTEGGAVGEFVVEIVSVTLSGVGSAKPVNKSQSFRDQRGNYELDDLEPGKYQLAIRSASGRATIAVTVSPNEEAIGNAELAVPSTP